MHEYAHQPLQGKEVVDQISEVNHAQHTMHAGDLDARA